MTKQNRYSQIIETIFFSHYKDGDREVDFKREEIVEAAEKLEIARPKNLGDVIYSFRYRIDLPEKIVATLGLGETWIILPTGRSLYRMIAVKDTPLSPSPRVQEIKVPDATPDIVADYLSANGADEQALLTRVRYNGLVGLFTGTTAHSLQNHLRTTVPDMGQVETDEVYIGVNSEGVRYVFPVQAKGRSDRLSIVQIIQDIALCRHKFPSLRCIAIGIQFLPGQRLVLFSFRSTTTRVENIERIEERHYRLVPAGEMSSEDLQRYREQTTV